MERATPRVTLLLPSVPLEACDYLSDAKENLHHSHSKRDNLNSQDQSRPDGIEPHEITPILPEQCSVM